MNAITGRPAPAPAGQRPESGMRAPVRRLRRAWQGLLLAVALAGTGVVGTWWVTEGRFIESTDNAYVQGDIAVLSPRIAGSVDAVLVTDNQAVRAGQPLIRLDPADWQARLDRAQAQSAEAEAAAETARRQLAQQDAAIAAARAAVQQARAEQTRARADAARVEALVGGGWTSRQAYDQAVSLARKAEAAVAMTEAQAAAAERQMAVLQGMAAQAAARQRNAAAVLRLAESDLANTVIRAPFDGIVGRRAAEPGQHVAPGSQVIAVAPRRERLYVLANFKETQLRRMVPGMPARLVPDMDPAAAVAARVDSLSPATGAVFSLLPPENATGNFTKVVQRVPVKLVLDGGDAARSAWLRPGLSVVVEVDTRGPGARRKGLFGAAAATLGQATP